MTSAHSPQSFSLKQRILSASSWILVGYVINYAIRLGSSLVMTRILVPQMFGVMAVAMMVMTGLAMFSDIGLSQNIIQSKRGGDPAYLNTAWAIQILRGVLLWLMGLCFSLIIFAADELGLIPNGSAYADGSLPYVIAGVSFAMVISAFRSTKYSEANRHLSLGRITQIQLVAQIAGLICMIGWILIDRSIWSLVAGYICSTAVVTVLSHTWLPGTPNRWHWDRLAIREILHFGKWMFLSSILGFVANSADRLLLGGFVDSATLGIYSIALTIIGSISQIVTTIFSNISYAALSEVARERSGELRRSLYRFHILTASFTYFCAGGLMASGSTLIKLLYDPRYTQAGWMLEILAVGLLSIPFNLAQLTLLARGLPRHFTIVIVIRVVVTVVLIPIGFYYYSTPGAVWAIAASQLSSVLVVVYYQFKCDLLDPLKELLLLPTIYAGVLVGEGFNFVIGHHLIKFIVR
jgi:O-antigen/teichoic acid export membrane protein